MPVLNFAICTSKAALMKALQEEQFLGMYLAYYQTIFFAGKKTAAEHH